MILHYLRNRKFEPIVLVLFVLAMLTGCGATRPPLPAAPANGTAVITGKGSQLLAEANLLADKVKHGEITRLAAADQLNRVRLRLVGANRVDDAVFASYRSLVRRRDEGAITQPVFQEKMKQTLQMWQRRWPTLVGIYQSADAASRAATINLS
jgi:hypothetical protein